MGKVEIVNEDGRIFGKGTVLMLGSEEITLAEDVRVVYANFQSDQKAAGMFANSGNLEANEHLLEMKYNSFGVIEDVREQLLWRADKFDVSLQEVAEYIKDLTEDEAKDLLVHDAWKEIVKEPEAQTEEVKQKEPNSPEDEEKAMFDYFNSKKVSELKKIADDLNIELDPKALKEDIINALISAGYTN